MQNRFRLRLWHKQERRLYAYALLCEGEYVFAGDSRDSNPKFLFLLESVVLMQCTGECDRNGVDIYEGDLVKIYDNSRYGVYEIRYKDACFWVDDLANDGYIGNVSAFDGDMEVIGNVYENPELLNTTEEACNGE